MRRRYGSTLFTGAEARSDVSQLGTHPKYHDAAGGHVAYRGSGGADFSGTSSIGPSRPLGVSGEPDASNGW